MIDEYNCVWNGMMFVALATIAGPPVLVLFHKSDVIMNAMASQITGVSNACLTVGLGPDQRKHQSSALLAFVRGIHWWPVKFPAQNPKCTDVLMNKVKNITMYRIFCVFNPSNIFRNTNIILTLYNIKISRNENYLILVSTSYRELIFCFLQFDFCENMILVIMSETPYLQNIS